MGAVFYGWNDGVGERRGAVLVGGMTEWMVA